MPQYTSSPLGLSFASKEAEGKDKIGNYDRGQIISNDQLTIFSGGTSKFGHRFFNTNKNYDNDISTSSIVEYTKSIASMKLNYSDFAYLKKLGVYPNNRLIIARRFLSPVGDDLLSLSADASNSEVTPMSTLISWVDDNKDFLKVSYGEEWTKAEASFKGVLNELGGDILGGDNKGGMLGDAAERAFNDVPLPGWTEGLQYRIFKSLGMTDLSPFEHPYGNPNLIRTAMRRETLDKGQAGSGLKATIEVEMEVEYEQKFINGVDPTAVYYDIIANALTFGTSESRFQFRGEKVGKFSKFLDDIGSGNPERVKMALTTFILAIQNSIKGIANKLKEFIANERSKREAAKEAQQKNQEGTDQQNQDGSTEQETTMERTKKMLEKVAFDVISGLVGKYKVRIIGIVNSLTGTPSTPWHVTIGNPKRPIFSSGDMLVTDVTVTMGKLLAFNDLPSSIKINFTLKNARPLGAQEIYQKLNCGKERTYTRVRRPYIESDISWKDEGEKKKTIEKANQQLRFNQTASAVNKIGDLREAAQNGYFQDHPGILEMVGPSGYVTYKTDDGLFVAVPTKNDFKIKTPNGEKNVKIEFYTNGRVAILENGKVTIQGTYVTDEGGMTKIEFDNGAASPVTINKDGKIT